MILKKLDSTPWSIKHFWFVVGDIGSIATRLAVPHLQPFWPPLEGHPQGGRQGHQEQEC